MKKLRNYLLLLLLCLGLVGCSAPTQGNEATTPEPTKSGSVQPGGDSQSGQTPDATVTPGAGEGQEASDVTTDFSVITEITLKDIPAYSGEAYSVVNDNVPFFKVDATMTESFEVYTPLDSLGRCGIVYANIGKDIMPTEARGEIGSVKPTGWQTAKYEIVDGLYLYNRCHLIGFQLTGENANRENLITGTRYMNVIGMLPFENMVDDYIEETGNHVMYRVWPMFEGDNLVATGVLMEGWSVEDNGEGICFNVFVYNIQPGIEIDYANGNNKLSEDGSITEELVDPETGETITYILNTNTKKFHKVTCGSAATISEKNRAETTKTRDELITDGYKPCGSCKP